MPSKEPATAGCAPLAERSTCCPPPKPDSKRLFDLLLKVGMDADDTNTLLQEVRNMAAANLIARFETKFDSKLEAQNAKIDGQSAQLASIRWIMGIGFTLLALLITLFRFLG